MRLILVPIAALVPTVLLMFALSAMSVAATPNYGLKPVTVSTPAKAPVDYFKKLETTDGHYWAGSGV